MVWGFIISLIFVTIIFGIAAKVSNKQFGVLSSIILAITFVSLAISVNKFIVACEIKSQTDDYIAEIQNTLSSFGVYGNEGQVSQQEAGALSLLLKTSFGSISNCFQSSDFVGIPYSQVLPTISADITKGVSKSIWNHLGWTVLIIVMGVLLVVITMEKKVQRISRDHRESHSRSTSTRHTSRHRN